MTAPHHDHDSPAGPSEMRVPDDRGPDRPAGSDVDDEGFPLGPPGVEVDEEGFPVRHLASEPGPSAVAVARPPLLARLVLPWRSSLQLRVVSTTLVLSALVVAVLGQLLAAQINDGLQEAKLRAALAESSGGLGTAESTLQQMSRSGPLNADAEAQQVCALVDQLASRGSSAGLFDVFLLSDDPGKSGCGSVGVDPVSIPSDLRAKVDGDRVTAYDYALISSTDTDAGPDPGLVVGAPVQVGAIGYQLYYLFPLSQEIQTLSLVRRTLALGGLALVALLALIAYLITRQVVRPVRLAARSAGRLAAGLLEERVEVRGKDDLARLGRSFNDMATSLQRQIVQLEELSRVQRRFVSDVSHELRTPLTTVRMAADVLYAAREDFPTQLSRSAELLQNELDRFESLLADLLEISRYDAGAADLAAGQVDVGDLVRHVVAGHALLAERRGTVLEVSLPSEPLLVELDGRRVERVLRNLVGNAVEHGEGRPIEVTAAADPDCLAITVRDHGIGLRPGEAGLVFNRFWRGDPSRARHTGGTGLGLAIALEDVRLHDGWLQAWGEPGRGAQFRLTLPRRAGVTLSRSPLPLRPADAPVETPDVVESGRVGHV